jgi:hypothetical protein
MLEVPSRINRNLVSTVPIFIPNFWPAAKLDIVVLGVLEKVLLEIETTDEGSVYWRRLFSQSASESEKVTKEPDAFFVESTTYNEVACIVLEARASQVWDLL